MTTGGSTVGAIERVRRAGARDRRACWRSSTASPAAARGSKPPPRRPTGPWSRSTRSIPTAPIVAEAPDPVEIRVVACLVEKQRTTPDVYPLSLNSLRIACNQSTNRDPVVDYDEATVVEAPAAAGAARLDPAGQRARAAAPASTATCSTKRSSLDAAEISLLAVLMLRGAQTPGELKQRSERLHAFADLAAVHYDARRPGRARAGRPPPAPPGPEGGALRAAARGRWHAGGRGPGRGLAVGARRRRCCRGPPRPPRARARGTAERGPVPARGARRRSVRKGECSAVPGEGRR